MNRRGFLGAILAAGAAPAIVRIESLMKIVVPTTEEVIEYAWDGEFGGVSMAEMNEIARRAFVPRMAVQIYNITPLLSRLIGIERP